MKRAAFAAVLALLPLPAFAAAPAADARLTAATTAEPIPTLLDSGQRDGYRAVFAAIKAQQWTNAQIGLDSMKPGPLHAIARAELYTAKGSPKATADQLTALLNEAPELPEAETLERLAKARGATALPPLPVAQTLVWQDGAPRRVRAKAIKSDLIAADLAAKMQPLVKADLGQQAQALLEATNGLTPEAATEWQQRVAWMYYLQGDDTNTRAEAMKAADGSGEWAIQGRWVAALSAWRQHDCTAAATAFEGVAARATDIDLRAAGLYWAARADMVCARPDRIEARLKSAAQFGESFYGQLARQALGIHDRDKLTGLVATDWMALDQRPNLRVAAALVEVGEGDLADDVIRQQARIGSPREFGALVRVAQSLNMPATTIWLAHNCPRPASSPPRRRATRPRTGPPTAAGESRNRWSMHTRWRNRGSVPRR